MSTVYRPSFGYMVFASILAIILGLIMLWYPGGIMAAISVTFWVLQAIISAFILIYTISEAIRCFKTGSTVGGVLYLAIGILATVLIWLFQVSIVYIIVALFFIVSGLGEIILGFRMIIGKYFMIFLGMVNILVGVIMLSYPIILPLLIAWYVLFWGISRLLLAFELKKIAS